MENLPINSDTINKSIDLIDESTKETRKEIDKTTAKGFEKLAQLIWASPVGRAIDLYIAERPYKMEKALEEMKQKYESIPAPFKVEPSSYIALKGVNELNYSLDEEHLKEMFQNLLVSDMDSRKKNKVLPSYIEMIKQLSKEDAEFLKLLKSSSTYNSGLYLISLQKKNNDNSYNWRNKYLLIQYYVQNDEFYLKTAIQVPDKILDNLLRLRIVDIPSGENFTYKPLYEQLFEYAQKAESSVFQELGYQKQILKITSFGKDFIDICLS